MEVASERQPVAAVHRRIGSSEPVEKPVEQVLEAQDVLPVVLERRLQVGAVAPAQPIEVAARDELASDVGLPFESKQPVFDVAQRAVAKPRLEQCPAEVEQIQVVWRRQLAAHPCHEPASSKKREVERGSVVGRQSRHRAQLGVERRKECGLRGGFLQQQLDELETAGHRARHRDRKDVRSGPARKPGRLSVEKGEGVGFQSSQLRRRRPSPKPAFGQHFGPAPCGAGGSGHRLEALRHHPFGLLARWPSDPGSPAEAG